MSLTIDSLRARFPVAWRHRPRVEARCGDPEWIVTIHDPREGLTSLMVSMLEVQPLYPPEDLTTDQLIDMLTDGADDEANAVTLYPSNTGFNDLPKEYIVVRNASTSWRDQEFSGETRRDCLMAALEQLRQYSGLNPKID